MADLATIAASLPEIAEFAALLRDATKAAPTPPAGPRTLFAPTDAALAQLDPGARQRLRAAPGATALFVSEHLAAGALVAADLMQLDSLALVSGARLAVDTTLGIRIGTAYLLAADYLADDGVLHIIDRPLAG